MAEKSFVDMTPCEVLADLKAAKHDYLMGRRPRKLRYRSDTGAEREMDHQQFDIDALDKAIIRYDGLCKASLGDTTGGRFSFIAGNQRL